MKQEIQEAQHTGKQLSEKCQKDRRNGVYENWQRERQRHGERRNHHCKKQLRSARIKFSTWTYVGQKFRCRKEKEEHKHLSTKNYQRTSDGYNIRNNRGAEHNDGTKKYQLAQNTNCISVLVPIRHRPTQTFLRGVILKLSIKTTAIASSLSRDNEHTRNPAYTLGQEYKHLTDYNSMSEAEKIRLILLEGVH